MQAELAGSGRGRNAVSLPEPVTAIKPKRYCEVVLATPPLLGLVLCQQLPLDKVHGVLQAEEPEQRHGDIKGNSASHCSLPRYPKPGPVAISPLAHTHLVLPVEESNTGGALFN